MGHQLEQFADGTTGMMYVASEGDPWHGLGVGLPNVATKEEAIEAAGLGWKITLQPVYTDYVIPTSGDSVKLQVPDKFAVVREPFRGTDAKALAVVGGYYEPLQNDELFEFFEQVVGQGKAIYHTAGVLFGGQRVWIAAKLPKDMVLLKEDVIKQYLVLTSSHDGTAKVTTLFTPIRVVCNNTLTAALQGSANLYTFRHMKNVREKFEEAAEALGLALKFYGELEQALTRLTEVSVTVAQTKSFVEQFIPMPNNPKTINTPGGTYAKRLATEGRDAIYTYIESGKGTEIRGVKGTVYGLYNAATEYVDWHLGARSRTADARLNSQLSGPLATKKREAFDLALSYAKN